MEMANEYYKSQLKQKQSTITVISTVMLYVHTVNKYTVVFILKVQRCHLQWYVIENGIGLVFKCSLAHIPSWFAFKVVTDLVKRG